MDTLTKAIARLIELTQKGVIKWERGAPPDAKATSDYVEVAFYAEHDGARFRVFRRRFKAAVDEARYDWIETPVLQIVDDDGTMLYEFPNVLAVHHLLDSVQYRISHAGPIIEKLASGA